MHETHGFSVADANSQVNPPEGHTPESSAPRHFPGTEPIEGETAIPSAEDAPAEKKPSWAERRAAKKAAAAAASGSDPGSDSPESSTIPGPTGLRLPWDVRVKIAVVLSFVILITVLIVNKKTGKGKDAGKGAPSVPLAIGDKAGKTPKPPTEGSGDDPKQQPAPAPPKDEPAAPAVAEGPVANKPTADTAPPESVPPDPAVKEVAQQSAPKDNTPAPEPPPLAPTTPTTTTPEPAPAIVDTPPAPAQEKPADAAPPPIDKPAEPAPTPIDKPAEPAPTPINKATDSPPASPPLEPRPDAPPTLDTSKDKPTTPAPAEPVAAPAPATATATKPAEPVAAPATMPSLSPTPPVVETPAPAAAQPQPDLPPGGGYPIPHAASRRTTLVAGVAAAESAPSQPAPRATSSGEGDDSTIHVVRRNENFWTISRYYYGSGRFYKALWEANRDQVKAIDDLYIGTRIRVPAVENLNRKLIEPVRTAKAGGGRSADAGQRRDARAERASTGTSELLMLPVADASTDRKTKPPGNPIRRASPRTEPSYRTHVVRGRFETLRSIARDELGDAEREDEILELNRDVIEDGAARVRVGTALKIPEDTRRK